MEEKTKIPLMNAEAAILLRLHRQSVTHDQELFPGFLSSLTYVQDVKPHKHEAVTELRSVLQNYGLNDRQVVLFANILPQNVEETRALIPSIDETIIPDDQLRLLIQSVQAILEV